MLNFKPSKMTLALISSGLIALSTPTFAAEEVAAAKKNDEKEIEVIQVSGFRKSIVESINLKRYSSNVVEAISAEDIGKLPDSSIAESIARLPGLAAQRIDGRASKVSIRGFGENESGTTLNGREQVSIGDNRGVEFDLYPSEIMSGVTVYKTPNASLEGEGIAGVIDLQTIKPLDQDGRVIQFNGTYEKTSFDKLNPDGDNDGLKGTFFYMDQFADDTLGVAFAYTTMASPNQEKRWNAWGYPEFEYEDGSKGSILGGAKPFVRSSNLERDSAMLVIEATPTDDIKMTFDALYVDFLDTKILRGIEIPFAWGQGSISADTAVIDAATGFVTSAITQDQRVVVRNDYEEREAQLMSLGFNTNWAVTDGWTLDFDVAYSKVERDVYSVESYAGTGRGDSRGAGDDLGYTFNSGNTGATFSHGLDYSDYNLMQLGGPLSWGWSGALNDQYGVTGTEYENQLQDGFINTPSIDDELMSLKFAASQELDSNFITEITYGVAYREREKTKQSEGYFMTLSDFSLDNPGMKVVPEEYREGTANLDFIGMGDMIAYDTMGLIKDGYYNLMQESLTNPTHATKSWMVNEKVMSAFVQAEISSEIAGMPLTGNVGVRYVYTDQSSQGNAFNTVDGLVVTQPTDVSHDYSHFLPSVNLSMQIDDTQTLRFGAAKTISRARLDEMNASFNASYNQQPDTEGNYWSVSGGNPSLEPKEAIGLDLSYENYFSAEGYFSVALFHKDLQNWIFDGSYAVDMTGVANPATGEIPATTSGTGNGKVNGGEGTLWGYELSATLPLNMLTEHLDGFGLIASYTGIESDMKDQNDNDYELPGLSKSITSATFYYDKNGFSARASMRKRDAFKGDVYGLGFNTVQVDIVGETIFDAQIGYDFAEGGFESLEGLSIFLQGYNLTEEPFTSLQGENALQVRDYQDYGSSYLLGFSYKM
ncbi:TonB-dependent receptor [Colwellia sp. MB02u-18]|uniref:TonB-dependent receptor n=1 Tax=unclassified Colwellia TaxID=196834 RepID=UPI0015F62B7A|nr:MULTISPECIES: TonB-dependent receptor [unclassified Colwellia]MBA6225378.1 TonB-dependent receptor [Colwellia sp. MB3u-45]MBA6265980.1 TonB-dependent receptor [Colwellia sp. MB3u-43]MBA6320755.1 TonB-dependent receptor [Colwellia sp. MB02u-19]MBA6323307.1 TonB-dependent receptor [Colwellia sp. MB02u-18]MBA6329672.1 TonB-dependent receptor [Colwellia sp. MB02u-12]